MNLESRRQEARALLGKVFGFDGQLDISWKDRVIAISDTAVVGHASFERIKTKAGLILKLGWVAIEGGLANKENLVKTLTLIEIKAEQEKAIACIVEVHHKAPYIEAGYKPLGGGNLLVAAIGGHLTKKAEGAILKACGL